jgi:hypothetical protein
VSPVTDGSTVCRKVLTSLASTIAAFGVRPCLIVGNFTFQRMALVKGLRELDNAFAAHDLITGMSGDVEACLAVASRRATVA